MSTWIWCELVCAQCAADSQGMHTQGPGVPRKALKQAAKKRGWTFQGNDALCALCSKEEAAKPTEPTLPTQGDAK